MDLASPGNCHDEDETREAGNLPGELTSFVGRRLAADEVKRALSAARLVTLTGVGGVGKSRLAVHVAYELDGFP